MSFFDRFKKEILSDKSTILDPNDPAMKEVIEDLFKDDKTKVHFVLYKDTYWFWSRVIRWWTKSKYSHCEFYIQNEDKKYLVGISNDCSVRIKKYDMDAEDNNKKWDIFEFNKNTEIRNALKDQFDKTQGCKYDWLGIVMSDIFARKEHRPRKYTCSEWAIEVLDKSLNIVYPRWYNLFTPGDIYNTVIKEEKIAETLGVKEVIVDGQQEQPEQK